jgi:2-C-methyl-D-erythritol 4-phosphate cytidylyltransferase / 2-C-methyl-D-erythritol 2,4-cyclodiphosphate synthase
MNYAIILAAGNGVRSKVPNKLFTLINDKPLLYYAVERICEHGFIDRVALVVKGSDLEKVRGWLVEWGHTQVELVEGGSTRQESAEKGVGAFGKLNAEDVLIIHNAANPFVTPEEITQVIKATEKSGAALVAHPIVDTLKEVKDDRVEGTVDRRSIWAAQTPQAMKAKHYQKAIEENLEGTDEMTLMEEMGIKPQVVRASINNVKITTKRDINFARFLIEGGAVKTGFGMDSHRFEREHRGLTLGGIHLKDEPQTIANSDGDVMIHALCNALLQAIGKGSIGTVADEMFEDGVTDSTEYLKEILKEVSELKMNIQHIGFQLEGAQPKVDPIAEDLKKSLAKLLSLKTFQIGITASTGEDLTPFGRGEGLQCFATVTLRENENG